MISNKKWNINTQAGFIDVPIEFFIGMNILKEKKHTIYEGFQVINLITEEEGELIIDKSDWEEIKTLIREIKINWILN